MIGKQKSQKSAECSTSQLSNGESGKKSCRKGPSSLGLEKELARWIFQKMLYSRILEERLIKIYKAGDAYFWIGGPGEEAFGVTLGALVKKGQGPEFDYLHLHYRATPTLVAMGMPMIDAVRLIMNRATDPCTGGRNFANHYCYPKWNVMPVTSPIEVQYVMALGTARVQKRLSKDSVTIVTGGDAGTAEGDFASCLVWSSRPIDPLPILITVQNNQWGISTAYEGQHGEAQIADRAKAFGMPTRVVDGLDPVECYRVMKELLDYCRKERKPAFLEAFVSRLYGHSSASGANFVAHEKCPVQSFEEKLLRLGVITEEEVKTWRADFEREGFLAWQQVKEEPAPQPQSIWRHVYSNDTEPNWRLF